LAILGSAMAGASVSYVLPPALGVHQPVAPDYIIMNVGTTAVERVAMKDAYTSAKAMYTKARAFHNFIKVQIIKVVPELYIGLLADDSTLGYANVILHEPLTPLYPQCKPTCIHAFASSRKSCMTMPKCQVHYAKS
jgi:hypothetical protein